MRTLPRGPRPAAAGGGPAAARPARVRQRAACGAWLVAPARVADAPETQVVRRKGDGRWRCGLAVAVGAGPGGGFAGHRVHDLSAMARRAKQRARERGADAEDLNALDNSEDPMAAAIGLVRAKTPKFPSEGEEWKFVYINSKEHRRIYQGKV